jgi:hypothetical protein
MASTMNDQGVETGRPKKYATMMFGQKKITIDRGLAKVGTEDSHRIWHYDGSKWVGSLGAVAEYGFPECRMDL